MKQKVMQLIDTALDEAQRNLSMADRIIGNLTPAQREKGRFGVTCKTYKEVRQERLDARDELVAMKKWLDDITLTHYCEAINDI